MFFVFDGDKLQFDEPEMVFAGETRVDEEQGEDSDVEEDACLRAYESDSDFCGGDKKKVEDKVRPIR